MKQVFWLFPYIPTYLLVSGRMLWLFWVVHLLIFCISISFLYLSYRFIKSVTELKNIKLSWPCQSVVGYYQIHDNNLKFYVVYDYILDANLSLRRPSNVLVIWEGRLRVITVALATSQCSSSLRGTPSGDCQPMLQQSERSAFGWLQYPRSLKEDAFMAVHPFSLWKRISLLVIEVRWYSSRFFRLHLWQLDCARCSAGIPWRIFQSVRAERPSFSFGGSDVYTTSVTCRYAHNAFLSSSQTMSV